MFFQLDRHKLIFDTLCYGGHFKGKNSSRVCISQKWVYITSQESITIRLQQKQITICVVVDGTIQYTCVPHSVDFRKHTRISVIIIRFGNKLKLNKCQQLLYLHYSRLYWIGSSRHHHILIPQRKPRRMKRTEELIKILYSFGYV